jgi:hypothetical protein
MTGTSLLIQTLKQPMLFRNLGLLLAMRYRQ